MKQYTCASFFCGVGGIDLGFEQTNKFHVIYANEFDLSPIKTYELNSKIKVDHRDIRSITAEELPCFDVMLAGFPCQAFSISGKMQGFSDDRGLLFFELIRIMKTKKPKIVFFRKCQKSDKS